MILKRKRRGADWKSAQQINPLVQLWIFRLLVLAGGHHNFISNAGGFTDDDLAKTIGIDEYLRISNLDLDEMDRRQCLKVLKSMHAELEETTINCTHMPVLEANIQRFKALAGLSDVDCSLLTFALIIHSEPVLEGAGDLINFKSTGKTMQTLALLLGLSINDVKTALSKRGRLATSGLLLLDHDLLNHDLQSKLGILSDSFVENMLTEDDDPLLMMSDVIRLAPPAQLIFTDYPHIAEQITIIRPYIRNSIEKARPGVNILFYGTPGTGKSELTRTIAADIGCELYEIASTDKDGEPVNGTSRMLSYRAAQNFLGQRRAIIVFDEAEDIFGDGGSFLERSGAQSRKAWMNRMLEENSIPTFWITNSISGLDSAFIRRFDVSLRLPVPPKAQREKIISKAGGDILSSGSMQRVVLAEKAAPGVVTRACGVIRVIKDTIPQDCVSKSVELLISSTLEAQGHPPLSKCDLGSQNFYDTNFVNTDTDLDVLAKGLSQHKEVRVCLFGPSGTGKTACGKWLASTLGLPIHVKKASDILGPYVGMSEEHIANAFREAEQEGAVLLIDEIDSFLRDRRGAQRSWEVTLVNEMLTQMESFPGIFIASTNLMDGIDQAALRRFDLKICFNYLRPEQAWCLFLHQCRLFSYKKPSNNLEKKIKDLEILTPGDFANITRQQRFKPLQNPEALLYALQAECSLKDPKFKKKFGFL